MNKIWNTESVYTSEIKYGIRAFSEKETVSDGEAERNNTVEVSDDSRDYSRRRVGLHHLAQKDRRIPIGKRPESGSQPVSPRRRVAYTRPTTSNLVTARGGAWSCFSDGNFLVLFPLVISGHPQYLLYSPANL